MACTWILLFAQTSILTLLVHSSPDACSPSCATPPPPPPPPPPKASKHTPPTASICPPKAPTTPSTPLPPETPLPVSPPILGPPLPYTPPSTPMPYMPPSPFTPFTPPVPNPCPSSSSNMPSWQTTTINAPPGDSSMPPPPPNPVLPYFPWMYRGSNHCSTATSLKQSTVLIMVTHVGLIFWCCSLLV